MIVRARDVLRGTATGWWIGLAIIAAVAFAVRVAIVVIPSHFVLFGDPVDYNHHAISIALGHGYPPTAIASPGTPSAFRPPAYPYLLAAVYAIGGFHLVLARLLGAVLGTVTVLLTALLGAELWDRRVGLFAGALAAVCPSLVALGVSLLSETLFLPVELGVALTVLALLRGRAPVRLGLLAGALCGIAGLTRSEGILWLAPALAALVLTPTTRRHRAGAVLAALAACAVVLAPWAIRNERAFHHFVPLNTQGGFTLVGQYNGASGADNALEAVPRIPDQIPGLTHSLAPFYRRPGGIDEVQLNRIYSHDAYHYILSHPIHVPIAVGLNLLRMFNLGKAHQFTTGLALRQMALPRSLWDTSTIFIQVITLIAIGGLVLRLAAALGAPLTTSARLRLRLGPPLVWAVPLICIAVSSLVGGTVRYRAPADPFLILLAAATLAQLARRRRASSSTRERNTGLPSR